MASAPLPDLTRLVYGTTRLGDATIPFEARVAVARDAISQGLALHTSHQYGDAQAVLKEALSGHSGSMPATIFKIGSTSAEEIAGQIEDQLEATGLDRMDVGQLCLTDALLKEVAEGGPAVEELEGLREEGLVGDFVVEVWPWNSAGVLDVFKDGRAEGLLTGAIFYLNPLQRFAGNQLWAFLRERKIPVVAMRTVAGGSLEKALASDGYLRERVEGVAPLYTASGCADWTEFCGRFVAGFPTVRSTVGATASPERLAALVAATEGALPLPDEITGALDVLQSRWAQDHDRLAAPWSM